MSNRRTVIPGEFIAEGIKGGKNTYTEEGKVYSKIYGFTDVSEDIIKVLPNKTKYVPKPTEKVIGIIKGFDFRNWYLDINSPYDARLPISLHPEYIESGELAEHLEIGDTVIAEIVSVGNDQDVDVKMDGKGLKKLEGGKIIEISPSKVPRVIGKNASMISVLKKETKCNIYVGQNGRVWIRGEVDEVKRATEAIKLIEEKAHTSGLTDKIKEFLQN